MAEDKIIDIELRRALVFAHLMITAGTPLHRKSMDYIHEKWMIIKDHPCPEKVLHMSTRTELFSHLDAWGRFTEEYQAEMKKWGVLCQ